MTSFTYTTQSLHRFVCKVLFLMMVLSVGIYAGTAASAQATPTINYQGKLSDNTGAAVADGSYNARFWLFQNTSQATTSAIWNESLTGADQVTVVNGLLSVMLGSTTAFTGVDFNQPLFLGVEIGGTGAPTWDGEMLPRKPLGTVPAAFAAVEAENAVTLGGVASTSFLRSDQDDTAAGLLTFSGGLLSTASTTITNLSTVISTTTTLVINGDQVTDLTGAGIILSSGALTIDTSTLDGRYASTTDFDTETELETLLSDVTSVFTNNDGALNDDDLSDNDTDDLAEGTNQFFTNARARAALLSTITGITYITGTGVFSATAGYSIPLTASSTNWNNFYTTPSSRITAGTDLTWSGNTLNYTGTDNNTQLTQEQTQDFIGTMVTGNTESGSTVTYDDAADEFDFIVANLKT